MKFKTVALASYPRSGNTWLRHLLHEAAALKSRYALNPETDHVHKAAGIPSVADEAAVLVKTHGIDTDSYEAAIHLVRSPFAAISSYLDYCHAFGVPLPDQSQFVIDESRGWVQHTRHWRMAQDCVERPECLGIRYEDLCWDTYGTLRQVCRFLGLEIPNENISHAAKTLTLEAMQRRGAKEFYPKGLGRNPTTNLDRSNIETIREICGEEMLKWRFA